MEAWRICAGWLVQCGALPPTHKTTWMNAEVFDLAQTLRDGVVLCQLLNHLKPGAVDLTRDICLRPQMSQFLCLKNIRTFLQVCTNLFGLRPQDLFDPSGLFDVTDFGQVIYTLSKLSQSPLVRQIGFTAFEVESQNDQTHDEDIYKNLEDLADEHDLADEGDIYDTVEEEDDSIYDDLVSLRKQAQQFQSPIPEKKGKRQYCIEEIVETEKKYVDALFMLINGFKKPLSHYIPSRQMKEIFLNLEDLHKCHCSFNSDLSASQNSRPSPHRTKPSMAISEVFLTHQEIFLQYGFYCSNLVPAQERVDEIMKDPTARQKIEECEYLSNKNRFRLRDLLSVPMQRCMKYHLLLRELIKHTEKGHPEKKELEQALDIMQDICLYVNEVKRDNEIMQNNRDIEKSMVNYRGPNVNEYGRLQNDGELKLKFTSSSKKGSTTAAQKYCFLFDKVLIVCNKGGKGQESHEFYAIIELEKYKIEDNLPKGRSGKWNWCFWLTPVNSNSDDISPVEIYCKTEDMMLKWVQSIRLAQDNINPAPKSQHMYDYTSFKDPTYCEVCKKLLRGLFFQGYKCSGCSVSVHKECLNSERVLQCSAMRKSSRNKANEGAQMVKGNKAYQGFPPPPFGAKPLHFEKNDIIEILDRSNPEWWKGRSPRTYEQGMLPADSVMPQRHSTTAGYLRSSYEESVPGMMQPPPHSPNKSPGPFSRKLLDSQWYVGNVDRHAAIDMLREVPTGCYLVRDSVKEPEYQTHAISIKHENQVKHMKVLYVRGKYGLVDQDSCTFQTLSDLITHYTQYSLKDVFAGLTCCLGTPVRAIKNQAVNPSKGSIRSEVTNHNQTNAASPRHSQNQPLPSIPVAGGSVAAAMPDSKVKRYKAIGTAKAMFSFTARESGELPLKEGQVVEIISKAGQNRGWWKGAVDGRIGYFPYSYVEEDESSLG